MKKIIFLLIILNINSYPLKRILHHDWVKIQLKKDMSFNLNSESFGLTPLTSAAAVGDIPTIAYFLDHGADINFQDVAGYTALGVALCHSQFETASYLLENGASLYILNNRGEAQIHAIKYAQAKIPKKFLNELFGQCSICLEKINKIEYIFPCGHAVHINCKVIKCPMRCH